MKNSTKKLFLYSAIIIGLFLVLNNFALALQARPDIDRPLLLDPSGGKEISKGLQTTAEEGFYYASESTNVFRSIALLIRYAGSFVGLDFVIIILYAGFQWMTAGGNEDKIAKAKKLLTNGVIGVAIVLLSLSIWVFIAENFISNIATEDNSTREMEEWEVMCSPWDYECKCDHGHDASCTPPPPPPD